MLLREAKRVLYRWFSRQTELFIKLKRLGETALNFNPYKRQTLRVYLTLLFRAVRLQDTYYVNNVGEIECILFGFVFSNCQYHLANMLFLLKVLLCLTNFSERVGSRYKRFNASFFDVFYQVSKHLTLQNRTP